MYIKSRNSFWVKTESEKQHQVLPRAGMTLTTKRPLCYRSKVAHLSRPWSLTLCHYNQPCKTFFKCQTAPSEWMVNTETASVLSKRLHVFRRTWKYVCLSADVFISLRFNLQIIACDKPTYTNSVLPPCLHSSMSTFSLTLQISVDSRSSSAVLQMQNWLLWSVLHN